MGCCRASLASELSNVTCGVMLSTVFGCLCRRRVLLRFVGALSPEKHARHDFASRFRMCPSAWSGSWLRSGARPLSEGTAALPWRVVCIWLACGRCLQCVARRLPRQRVWCVVDEGLNSASLARGRIAHSLPNAHAALVGFVGGFECWGSVLYNDMGYGSTRI